MKKNLKAENEAKELEKFQCFLFEMDDVLEPFIAVAANAGFQLDYSIDSLSSLEQFALAHASASSDSQFQNRVAEYLGEVFRQNLGGKWELCLKDPEYLFYNLPVITGYSQMSIEFCPIEVVANFLVRKDPGLLRRAVESHLEFKKP